MKIQFVKSLPKKQTQTIVIPVFEKDSLKAIGKDIDANIATVAVNTKSFKAKNGETLHIHLDGKRAALILGLGNKKDWSAGSAETAGGKLCLELQKQNAETASLMAGDIEHIHHIAAGVRLRGYTFDKYKSKTGDETALSTLHVVCTKTANVQKDFTALNLVLDGVMLARDLVNEAPNALYPESYAEIIKAELRPLGVKVSVLDEKKMDRLGMGAIMAVGKGSERQPRMVVMEWDGRTAKPKKTDQPIALVGKGVTFDTGGISIKPGAGMDEMKMDMGGSAAVVGTMKALAANKAKSHVIGIVGLAENMPSSNAYRPGDILTSYSGKTIEVLNTDAEGRLVLADTLSYVQGTYNPHTIIDLATLTGAMMVALGHEYTGTFANDDTLWSDLDTASKVAQEKLWRMPLDKVWFEEVVSDIADVRNMGKSRFAGANTAAAFLEHFIDDNRKWAHMDIAGTAWSKAEKPTTPKYGSGVAVRTLYEFVTSAK